LRIPTRAASVEGVDRPVLILVVEDEVTGTGSLIHRLIFGVTEKDGKIEVLRDWELVMKRAHGQKSSWCWPATDGAEAVMEHLKQAFDVSLSAHASTLRRPISWPEMLFLSSAAG